ncbi:MAG: DUF4142 domain-containing protein [Gemmatimonadaceae bacterium]
MKTITLLLTTAALLSACSKGDNEAVSTDSTASVAPLATETPAASATPAAPAVTDPQIAAIVVAANDADIAGGRLAASTSKNSKVKEFAQRMITDHSGVNKAAVALVTKLNVKPEESEVSRQQTDKGAQVRESLKGKTGADFDRAYIASEITYHVDLLGAIDTVLIPSSQNAELKALLEQTRPAVEAHLKHARELEASLGQG